MAETILGESLSDWLTARRANGCSHRRISDLLAERHIDVAPQTVQHWCQQMDIPKGEPS